MAIEPYIIELSEDTPVPPKAESAAEAAKKNHRIKFTI